MGNEDKHAGGRPLIIESPSAGLDYKLFYAKVKESEKTIIFIATTSSEDKAKDRLAQMGYTFLSWAPEPISFLKIQLP